MSVCSDPFVDICWPETRDGSTFMLVYLLHSLSVDGVVYMKFFRNSTDNLVNIILFIFFSDRSLYFIGQ